MLTKYYKLVATVPEQLQERARQNNVKHPVAEGKGDQGLFLGNFFARNRQTLVSLNTEADLRNWLELMETASHNNIAKQIYKSGQRSHRTSVSHIPNNDLRAQYEAYRQRHPVPLEYQVRFATLVNRNVTKPSYLFEGIQQCSNSLADETHLPVAFLNSFVNQIVLRANQEAFSFDHLSGSSNYMHSRFRPYDLDTFDMVRRIKDDILKAGDQMTEQHFAILANLYSTEPIFRSSFKDGNEMEELAKFVGSLADKEFVSCKHAIDYLKMVTNLMGQVPEAEGLADPAELLVHKVAKYAKREAMTLTQSEMLNLNSWCLKLASKFPPKRCSGIVQQYQGSKLAKRCEAILADHWKQSLNLKSIPGSVEASAFKLGPIYNDIGPILTHYNHSDISSRREEIITFLTELPNFRSLIAEDLDTLFQLITKLYEVQASKDPARQAQYQRKLMQDC